MRVLIDYRPALRERSGVGEYTHELAKALLTSFPARDSSRRLDLTIFSSSWKDRLVVPPDLRGATTIDRRVPVQLLNVLWHRLEWPPAETLTGRAFDVTHSLHPLLLPSRHAAQVIMIHDLNFLTHPEQTRAEIRRDYASLARAHAHRADRIIVPSSFTAGEVERRLEVPRDRIAVCSPGAPDWTPRAAAPSDGYILFFGTLEPRKNVGGLLDAYEQLLIGHNRAAVPELVLAGRPTDESRAWLDRVERPPLKGAARHIGYVDPADRRALYADARLLVQPSFEEGFGIPVLEAMALGVPVVAANRGALPEVLGDAGPLVDPERPADMARAIARILSDHAYAAECAA
ncbi:MAG: glycosyltransferase family 4 protein, partial [Acidobacteria bacterium]|nr:glycosyltransferase family 4 protein [Acidobacteriota bacterium]